MSSLQDLGNPLNKRNRLVVILVLVVVGGGALWLSYASGKSAGYAQAQKDIQDLQEGAGRTALAEAAKSANPFQAVNPLEGVVTNPFDKVKKILNPFEK